MSRSARRARFSLCIDCSGGVAVDSDGYAATCSACRRSWITTTRTRSSGASCSRSGPCSTRTTRSRIVTSICAVPTRFATPSWGSASPTSSSPSGATAWRRGRAAPRRRSGTFQRSRPWSTRPEMCGICGFTGARADDALDAMVDALHHRGPDDAGIWTSERASLGMARLAVLDPSPAGHQPMTTPDGTIHLVYNGEVYNFADLRAALQGSGAHFRSGSDTEVVLRLYERYGDDFVVRLRGMFAVAIWDGRPGPGRERLVLARDQLGIKPLLYAEFGGRFVFASELKALLASGFVPPTIDPVALRTLLTYGSTLQPRTMLTGVRSLPPGHRAIVERGRLRIERYWSLGLDRRPELRNKSYADQVSAVAEVLEEAARLQLVSDVPLGAFLSGGVDSAILVALMAKALGTPVRTFSVGYAGEADDIDESADAARMARHLGT